VQGEVESVVAAQGEFGVDRLAPARPHGGEPLTCWRTTASASSASRLAAPHAGWDGHAMSLNLPRVRGGKSYAHLVLPAVLLTAAALFALLTGPNSSRSSTKDGDPYHASSAVDTNPSPKIFETTITATPATVDIGQGVKAHALTFNGSIPGPTFRLDVGERVIVHFHNELNEETGIHWHGIEVPNPEDGTPLTQNQVKPGGTFRYEFKVTRPGIFWYHPHHHSSTNQVFKGMYGMIVVRDPLERLPQLQSLLPPIDRTLRIALSDMTVCKAPGSNDAVTYDPSAPHVSGGPLPAQVPPTPKDLCETRPVDTHGAPRAPFAAGDIPNIQQSDALANPTNEGQTVLTNGVNVGARAGTPASPGQLSPTAKTFTVGASQQVRLQLLNASTTRYMRLKLTTPSGEHSALVRIGGEGGLLDKARTEGGHPGPFSAYETHFDAGEIVLPPGGRADVLARMRNNSLGGSTEAESGMYTLWTEDFLRSATGFAGLPTVPVMHFRVLPSGIISIKDQVFGGTQLRGVDDAVEALPATIFKPLDPAGFPTPKPGLSSPKVGLTVDAGGFGIDGTHGVHDGGGDFMQAPHVPTARYVQSGRTYELSAANQTGSRHPFHLHGFSIQPLDLTRPSSPTYTWDYHEFVDTVDIPPGYTLRFRVRIDRRPFAGNPDSTSGGEKGRWVMHCHIFSHAEDGMLSELVVTGNVLENNERPQMTIDNVDVTGIRGRTVTASGTYADPDGDAVNVLVARDADTDETIGKITKDGTDHGRWTWTYPVSATDHDRHVKILEIDDKFDGNQRVLDLHVQDPPAPTPTPTATPTPSGGQPQPQTTPAPADRTAPVIRRLRVKRLARATRVRVGLSERARLTVTVRRRGHRVVQVSRAGVPGRNTLKVRKRLRPGRYAVIARAVDAAGNRARPVKVGLRVRRR
jgi:FtsP/CotA-like multicopper oxidase with cupredoxin domain